MTKIIAFAVSFLLVVATSCKAQGLSQEELQAFQDKLLAHWNPPVGASQPITLRIELKRDGTFASGPAIETAGQGAQFERLRDSAVQAVFLSLPFTMFKQESYEAWKELSVTLDPREGKAGAQQQMVPAQRDAEQKHQPSFDCISAKTVSARLICADSELSQLDSQLGAAFQKRKAQLSAAEQPPFVRDQVIWIRDRNKRCDLVGKDNVAIEAVAASKPCMMQAIQLRVSELETQARQQTEQTKTIAPAKAAPGEIVAPRYSGPTTQIVTAVKGIAGTSSIQRDDAASTEQVLAQADSAADVVKQADEFAEQKAQLVNRLKDLKTKIDGASAVINEKANAAEVSRQAIEELRSVVSPLLAAVAENGDVSQLGTAALKNAIETKKSVEHDPRFTAEEREKFAAAWEVKIQATQQAVVELEKARGRFLELMEMLQHKEAVIGMWAALKAQDEVIKTIHELTKALNDTSDDVNSFITWFKGAGV